MKSGSKVRQTLRQRWWLFTAILVGIALLFAIVAGYWFDWSWTGLNPSIGPHVQQYQPGKTLWDWIQLLFVPLLLAIGIFWLNHNEHIKDKERELARSKIEREIAADNQQERSLQEYFNFVYDLLREQAEKNLLLEAYAPIIRVRTLTLLRTLDKYRVGIMLKFLHDTDLLKKYLINDLRNIDLSEVDLERINLSNINLTDAALSKANLSRADLHEVQFNGANLNNANLSWANLSSANLAANIHLTEGMGLFLSRMMGNNPNVSNSEAGGTNLAKANLHCADLSNATFNGADLRDANLSQADLSDAAMMNADLTNANLRLAKLSGADLTRARLKGADLSGIKHYTDELSGIRWSEELRKGFKEYADLTGANLSYADLENADLSHADLSNANLSYANLKGVDLRDAILNNTNLNSAKLDGAIITEQQKADNLSGAIVTPEQINMLKVALRKKN